MPFFVFVFSVNILWSLDSISPLLLHVFTLLPRGGFHTLMLFTALLMLSRSALFSGFWKRSLLVYMSVRVLTYLSKFCSVIGSCCDVKTRNFSLYVQYMFLLVCFCQCVCVLVCVSVCISLRLHVQASATAVSVLYVSV